MNKRILIGLLAVLILAIVLPLTVGANKTSYDSSSVHPVTREELIAFLGKSPVHNRTYNETYDCLNFAVDLWYGAYLNGMDAFIIIFNRESPASHVRVGFYFTGNDAELIEYWGTDKPYFVVEPQSFHIVPLNYYDATQIIGVVSGGGALQLYKAVHGGSKIPIIKITAAVGKYKFLRLFI